MSPALTSFIRASRTPNEPLLDAERAHLAAVAPLTEEFRPSVGMIVLDRDGDAWEFGRTLWTCRTQPDGGRVVQVARLPHAALVREHGPIRPIGDRAEWRYRTIRGR